MIKLNTVDLVNTINNSVEYSMGFIEGVKGHQTTFNKILADVTVDALEAYIDSQARNNPMALHHVYEWAYVGRPEGRLFVFDSVVTQRSITITSQFLDSKTVKQDGTSSEPFREKARVMEEGVVVTIVPKRAEVLAFEPEDGGEIVFTKGPVTVNNPGGFFVHGGFASAVKSYFDRFYEPIILRDIFRRMSRVPEFNQFWSKNAGTAQGRIAGRKYMSKPILETEI